MKNIRLKGPVSISGAALGSTLFRRLSIPTVPTPRTNPEIMEYKKY
jgi:hypothetical protein